MSRPAVLPQGLANRRTIPASDICAAQGLGVTPARPAARCRRCVSLVGKSPSGHLFESLTCGYSQSSMTLPELNPHTVVLNPS